MRRATPSTRASGRSCGNAKLLWTNRLLIMENRAREAHARGGVEVARARTAALAALFRDLEVLRRRREAAASAPRRDPRVGRRRRGAADVERGRGAPSDARPARRRRRAAEAEAKASRRCEAGCEAAASTARAECLRTNCNGSRPSSRPSSRACPTPRAPSKPDRGRRSLAAQFATLVDEQHDQVVTLDGLVGDTANQVDRAGDHVAQAASRRATLPRVFNAVVLSRRRYCC